MFVDIQPSPCLPSNFLLSSSRCRSIPFFSRIRAIVPNMAFPRSDIWSVTQIQG
jgi:hypothetical protein